MVIGDNDMVYWLPI